jgi:hypothetical protein
MNFKPVFLILCLISLIGWISSVGVAATIPDDNKTVWVLVRHECFGSPFVTVIVEMQKKDIICTLDKCPNTEIIRAGEGYDDGGNYTGLHIVTIEKDYLRDKKHWTYKKPKTKPIKGNNFWLWEV